MASVVQPKPIPQYSAQIGNIIANYAAKTGINPLAYVGVGTVESDLNPLSDNGRYFGLFQMGKPSLQQALSIMGGYEYKGFKNGILSARNTKTGKIEIWNLKDPQTNTKFFSIYMDKWVAPQVAKILGINLKDLTIAPTYFGHQQGITGFRIADYALKNNDTRPAWKIYVQKFIGLT
jgi:hypothetical protein